MKSTSKTAAAAPGAETRDIPPPPGGGSWAFDYEKWDWISNDPAQAEQAAAAEPAAAPEQPAAPIGEE